MRIATYNVEWFSYLFDIEDNLIADDEVSGRQGVTRAQQLERWASSLPRWMPMRS